jgi:hypothetical protein
MRDLNEDLDEQFREAVDRYTLRPVDSQWDELSGKIISIKRSSPVADPVRSKYRRWALVLVLLILLPVAYIMLVPGNSSLKSVIQIQGAETNSSAAQPGLQKAGKKTLPVQGQSADPLDVKTSSSSPALTATTVADFNKATPETLPDVSDQNPYIENAIQSNPAAISPSRNELEIDASDFVSHSLSSLSTDLAVSEMAPLTIQTNTQKNLPLKHLDYPHRQGFYIGILSGPMLTQVKNQGLKKSGFDLGLLGGYTLGKKFSIESGIYFTQQYYYVSGKYYNEFAGINYAAGLEGRRTAFEVPLNVKYNFIRQAGGNFFATAGVSTFIGVNDKVLIRVAEGAIPPSAHFDYGNTSYLPSYMNISAGYEYKIGKSADIRVEPYVQIPLNSNTGNSFKTASSGASIQVFNAGIHIGISDFIR